MPATPADTDPSVCYRHPHRSSWTLCSRCGRTICPECQILTPSGVRCPDCVRETGGSVQWQPAAGAKPKPAKKRGARARPQQSPLLERVSASTLPVWTIGIAGTALLLWLVGFVTGNAPAIALAATPDAAWQIWRYVTSAVAYPASGVGVVFVLLSIGIFTWISWGAERVLGRRRFITIFLVSTAGAAAISLIAGGMAYGLIGAIWGLAGAFLIEVWQHPAARNRMLVSILIWLLISLFLGGNLVALIGGLLTGIGATLLLRRYADRPGPASRPYLLMAAAIGILIVIAILRSAVVVPLG